jgi:hypothetical protein
MNPSLRQLAYTLLWSETDNADESGGEPLDANYTPEDIDTDSLRELSKRFQSFVAEAEQLIAQKVGNDWSSIDDFYTGPGNGEYQTEHHFILTANGHGCGFWETSDWPEEVGEILTALAKKHSEIHADVGDDGKIYLNFC